MEVLEKNTTNSNIQTEVFEFVKECAKNLHLMQGIETSLESLMQITDYLVKTNPGVLESREMIFKMLPYGNFAYKKQLTIEDFTITPQKLSKLKALGEKWYNQSQIEGLMKNFESIKIKNMMEYIETLKKEIEHWKFRWATQPEIETGLGWKDFIQLYHELMEKDVKTDEKIRFLEKQLNAAGKFIERIKNKFEEARNEPEKLIKILSNLLERE